jgi:hypothetical protein
MNMPKNLPALRKAAFILVIECVLCGNFSAAQESPDFQFGIPDIQPEPPVQKIDKWYRSNASGMALEEIASRFAALRNEYSLSIAGAAYNEIPASLLEFYNPVYSIETRVLFENGGELRRQWIFRDERGITRMNASGGGGLFGGAAKEDEEKTGFIEIYNDERFITEEHQFAGDGSELTIRFFYNGETLIKTESWGKDPPPEHAASSADESGDEASDPPPRENEAILLITDYYRYTRFHSLRSIERVYHSDETAPARTSFPGIADGFSFGIETPVSGAFYDNEFFEDVASPSGTAQSVFTVDSRGRVLSEKRTNENGEPNGEIVNTWTGDRLASVEWKAEGDERKTEYEYDAEGNRSAEWDYRNGVLERSVLSEGGGRETEELYMNGEVILRTVWVNGRKVSEERVRRLR